MHHGTDSRKPIELDYIRAGLSLHIVRGLFAFATFKCYFKIVSGALLQAGHQARSVLSPCSGSSASATCARCTCRVLADWCTGRGEKPQTAASVYVERKWEGSCQHYTTSRAPLLREKFSLTWLLDTDFGCSLNPSVLGRSSGKADLTGQSPLWANVTAVHEGVILTEGWCEEQEDESPSGRLTGSIHPKPACVSNGRKCSSEFLEKTLCCWVCEYRTVISMRIKSAISCQMHPEGIDG